MLLTGTTDRTLLDIMGIAALSGMRIEETARVQVRDVDTACYVLTARAHPTTPAARRQVRIHPDRRDDPGAHQGSACGGVRCLRRHGISRLPEPDRAQTARKRLKSFPDWLRSF